MKTKTDKIITYSCAVLFALLAIAILFKLKFIFVIAEILGAALFITVLLIAISSIDKKYNISSGNKKDKEK